MLAAEIIALNIIEKKRIVEGGEISLKNVKDVLTG